MAKLELSVNKIIKNMVINDVFLATSLNRGYTNLSAVARDLKPAIERKLGEGVTIESIISGLKRNRDTTRKFDKGVLDALSQSSIQVLTSVTKFVIQSRANGNIVRWAYELKAAGTIYITTGSEYTTLIAEDRSIPSFSSNALRDAVDRKSGLSVIVLKSPVSILEVPGFLMSVYSKLAFAGINIEETTNSYTDAIIVVSENDSGEAFNAIHELLEFARNETKPS